MRAILAVHFSIAHLVFAIDRFQGFLAALYGRLSEFTAITHFADYASVDRFALVTLQGFVDAGKLDTKAEVTEESLVASGIVRRKLDGVRLLAKGELKAALNITVTGASKAAVEAVEKAGGKVTLPAAPAAAE